MRSLIAYFIKYPVAGNVLMFVILIFGFFGLLSLKSSFFPETESKVISIQAVYPGASPEEMEEGIVIKIEDNLKGVTGIERVSSVSRENGASISVEVLKGFDTDLILQDVKNAVDRINSFPAGLEPLVVYKLESFNFAISFALSGNVDLNTLKKFARQVESDLRSVEGISKVELSGFPEEEIEISFRENDLRAYQLSFEQAAAAVRRANLELTGGTIKGEREELLLRAKSKGYYAEDLRNIVVKTSPGGRAVYLSDVADIKDKWADNPSRSFFNQKPSVVITIQSTIDEDILFTTEYIRDYVEKFNAKNDETIQANIIRDGSVNLRQRIDLLLKNGIIGVALVLLFLALFLNRSLAFWVAASLPICFMGMFIIAAFYGLSINVISLFGMILVIGILVDDGIVIAENIYQHFEKGKTPTQAAIDGTMEVMPAVISAVLTTVIAFSTFYFLEGRLGEFFQDMGFVVIFTLLFSLVEGLFILPGHIAHSNALKENPSKNWFDIVEGWFNQLMAWMRDKLYAPIFRFSLDNKLFSIGIFIALFVITIGAIRGGVIKTTFFPFVERDNLSVTLSMPSGTREHITEKWITHIEKAVWEVNDEYKSKREDGKDIVLGVEKKLGPAINEASLNIILLDGETRQLQSFVVSNAIREKAGEIPGADKVAYNISSPFGRAISISLLGADKEELEAAKEELMAEMGKLSSLKDIVDSEQAGLREVNIKLKEKARLLGLSEQEIVGQVRQGFFGSEVQRLQRGIDEVKVWVRYKNEDRSSIEDLKDMRIRLADGRAFPLEELATIELGRGIIAINHLDGKREIKVEADQANPNESTTDILSEVQTEILPPILEKYPSVQPSYEGQSRTSAKTGNSAAKALPVILLCMFFLIVFTFRSFWQAVLVLILIPPLGLIGVGWGHFIHGSPISVLSALGIIALVGVMVNDSLVLVSAMNGLLKEGKDFRTAVYEAGLSRFRPILLTSITTIAGLGPLILEKSFQAQFLIPMAISLAYGLLIATFTTLFALPILLMILNQAKVYLTWLWEGKKPSEEMVEPAVKELVEEQHEKERDIEIVP